MRPVDAELEAVRPLAARLHDPRRVVGIGRARVGPVEPVDGRGHRQAGARLPLHAHLVVGELLRLHLLGDGGERRELVAGAGQVRDAVAAVDRDGRDRLEDDARARRDQVVDAVQGVAVAVVVVREVEAVEAQAAQHLQRWGQLDLVLDVGRGDVGLEVVVGVGRALAVGDRRVDRRVGERDRDRRGGVVEEAGVAEVVGVLPADLDAGEEVWCTAPGRPRIRSRRSG